MAKDENKPTGREIADRYRFEEVKKLGRDELVTAYKELYKLYCDSLAENEALKTQLEDRKDKPSTAKKITYSEYDPSWKGIDKVLYILKENKRVMMSSEILIVILGLDKALVEKWDKPYPALVKYISRGVKFHRIMQIKFTTKGIFYGLPEWFDNGQLRKSHLPNL